MTGEHLIEYGMTYLGKYYTFELMKRTKDTLPWGAIKFMEDFNELLDEMVDTDDIFRAIRRSYNYCDGEDFDTKARFVSVDENEYLVSLNHKDIGRFIIKMCPWCNTGDSIEEFFNDTWSFLYGDSRPETDYSRCDTEFLAIEYRLKGTDNTKSMMALAQKAGMVEELENTPYKNLHEVMEKIIEKL